MIHVEKVRQYTYRDYLIPCLVVMVMTGLFYRLWNLQVVRSEDLKKEGKWFTRAINVKHAPRGKIVDRNGMLLAGVKKEFVFSIQAGYVKYNTELLNKLSSILEISVHEILDKIKSICYRPYLFTRLYTGISVEKAAMIAELEIFHKGIRVDSEPIRFYSSHKDYSHFLGYVHNPNEGEIQRLLDNGEKPRPVVGKSGIEYRYELKLMGIPGGENLDVDVRSKPLKLVSVKNPVPGSMLVLGIDQKLQEIATEGLKGRKGAVVALDPKSGEVLCLASSPAYNIERFKKGLTLKEWKDIRDDKSSPMLNRAVSSCYAPASIFKLVLAIAAMQKGIFSEHHYTYCGGYSQVGNRKFRCLSQHGEMNFFTALAKSCNTYFVDLALKIGIDGIRRTCEDLGLGEKTGIDIAGEITGIVPSESWIRKWRNPPVWRSGDTANLGLGQGEISVTPIQMAQIASVIASKGSRYTPHILKTEILPNGIMCSNSNDYFCKKINLPTHYWEILHKAMEQVVLFGTVSRYRIPGIDWCAKTGTAQHKKGEKPHSWCMAFGPKENPSIALCIIVESVGYGSQFAAPIAQLLINSYIRRHTPQNHASGVGEVDINISTDNQNL